MMAEHTKIEWTDHTFNPWEGCQKVAPECDNCYAEARDVRFTGGTHWGPKAPRRRTSAQNWQKPHRWNAQAEAFQATHGRRQRVFCASLADVFDNAVDPAWRDDLWELIWECDQLDWLLLTKRPQNMIAMLPEDWGQPMQPNGWPHVWLGTSAGSQKTASQNIPHLLQTPAAVRFVSAEPLLGPIDLSALNACSENSFYQDALSGEFWDHENGPLNLEITGSEASGAKIDWVIVGGESGRKARPMHPDWARSFRDQCVSADVPFFFKQWGEWAPGENVPAESLKGVCADATWFNNQWDFDQTRMANPEDKWDCPADVYRIGKKAAGRNLYGHEWNEVPS